MGKKKLISLLLLSPMAFGQMKPLLEYLNSVDELGTEEVFYANYRCLSLFRMIANVTDGDPDENSTRINGLVKESFDEVLEMTFPLWQLLKEDSSADAFYENLANPSSTPN